MCRPQSTVDHLRKRQGRSLLYSPEPDVDLGHFDHTSVSMRRLLSIFTPEHNQKVPEVTPQATGDRRVSTRSLM